MHSHIPRAEMDRYTEMDPPFLCMKWLLVRCLFEVLLDPKAG